MIVRELLAVFGLTYDKTGQQEAEKGLQGLTRQADTLQSAFSAIFQATAIAAPFVVLTKLASDAQENLNLLNVVFQDSADEVEQWANASAEAIGQSRFALQELAARFGGLTGAMVGPGAEAAEMSMQLSALAVDMSSLYRVQLPKAENALIVLQSALAGETEAIKRFGVDMSVSAQKVEAMRMGLGGNVDSLTKAQKAQIRYNIILRDLAFVQGDASRTVDQFAGSLEATKGTLRDIGTELGFFLLPAFESALIATRAILKPVAEMALRFREWAADTALAKGALLGLVTVIGALLLPLLLKMTPLLLAFATFALIMDDVIVTFEGGTSVLGEFTELLDGLENSAEGFGGAIIKFLIWPLNRLRDILGAVGLMISAMFEAAQTGSWAPLARATEAIGGSMLDAATDFLKGQGDIFARGNQELFTAAKGFIAGGGAVTAPVTGARGAGAAPVTFQQGSRSYSFEISQQPGESAEDFTQRVAAIIDQKEEERDQALTNELVQGAVQ